MSRLTNLPTLSLNPSCTPRCAEYFSCGQTYSGCVTACPGLPLATPSVPDYVISACLTASSTSSDNATPIGTGTAGAPTTIIEETVTQTIHTIGTESGVFTILTDTKLNTPTTKTPTQSNSTSPIVPIPTQSVPSSAGWNKGVIKFGFVLGSLVLSLLTA